MAIEVISNNKSSTFKRELISSEEHSKSIEYVHTFDMAVPNNTPFVENKDVSDLIVKAGYERPQYYYDTDYVDNMWVKVYITHLLVRRKVKVGDLLYSKAYGEHFGLGRTGSGNTLTPQIELNSENKCFFLFIADPINDHTKQFIGKDGYVLLNLEDDPIVIKNNKTVFKTIDAGEDTDDWFYDEENGAYYRYLKLYLSIKNKALTDTNKQIKFSIKSNHDFVFHAFGYTKGSIRKNNNVYQHKVNELLKECREKFISITSSTSKKDIQDNPSNLALFKKFATFLNIDNNL